MWCAKLLFLLLLFIYLFILKVDFAIRYWTYINLQFNPSIYLYPALISSLPSTQFLVFFPSLPNLFFPLLSLFYFFLVLLLCRFLLSTLLPLFDEDDLIKSIMFLLLLLVLSLPSICFLLSCFLVYLSFKFF